jgi:hypothetical protein
MLASGHGLLIRGNGKTIERVVPGETDSVKRIVWKRNWFTSLDAMVIAKNSIVVAGQMEDTAQDRKVVPAILALDPIDGSVQWAHRLPERVVSWGLAVNRSGHVLVSMANGDVACLEGK